MDQTTSQALSAVLTAILGTGGVATVLAALKAWKTNKGSPATEKQAVAHIGADWEALNKYWKTELARVRAEQTAERQAWAADRAGYRAKIGAFRRRIDMLENHIWLRLPPPPPPEEEEEGPDLT